MKNIEKGLDGLVYIKDGSPQVDNAEVEVSQGVIEGSNVNAIGAMVKMIELARNFEMQTNIMKMPKRIPPQAQNCFKCDFTGINSATAKYN